MEWIFIDSKKADRRLKKYFNAPNNRKSIWFGEEWTKSSLKDRMRDVGFETEKKNQEDYYEWVVLPMHDYSHGNVMSLPTPPKYKKRTTENFILQILAQSLQHLLKAYDFAFDEAYPQHKEVLVLINANMRMVRQEDIDNLKN